MKHVNSNIKVILIAIAFVTGLFFTSCGRAPSNADPLTPEFFAEVLKGEITVSAYETSLLKTYLEEAARIFEARYPGTKINVETFSAMPVMTEIDTGDGNTATMSVVEDNPQSKLDYLNRISTKIMSGAGADIYAMDIIPIYKFIESGTLENLERFMNEDSGFIKTDYRQNIIEALRYRNGIWFMPMCYDFTHYNYDAALIPESAAAGFGTDKAWSSRELIDIGILFYGEKHKFFNTPAFSGDGDSPIFRQLLNENIRHFVNIETKRANFLDGEFVKLLETVKRYADEGIIPKGFTSLDDMEEIWRQITEANSERFFFKSGMSFDIMNQFYRKSGMESWGGGGYGGIEDDDEIAGIRALNDGTVPFNDYYGFGINSQSKNKALAWAFLKFLLSEEMQLSVNMYIGYPLNNKAREERMELFYTGALWGIPADILNDRQRQGLQDYKATVEKLSDSINTFLIKDTNINDMIAAEVKYFFNGLRTADEVARVLQNKADLYLSE